MEASTSSAEPIVPQIALGLAALVACGPELATPHPGEAAAIGRYQR